MLNENEIKMRLMDIARVISAHAGKNEELRKALSDIFERTSNAELDENRTDLGLDVMPSPFALLQEKGTDRFREWVSSLEIDDLKKVISSHRLDATGNARKWKTKDKLVDFVVERVTDRSKQGGTFKDYGDTNVSAENDPNKPMHPSGGSAAS